MIKRIPVFILMACSLLQADADFDRAKIIALRHARNSDFDQALDAFRQYLKKYPDNPLAYVETAQIYMNLRDYTNAARILQTGLANLPRSPELYHKLAGLYFTMQDYTGVIRTMNLLLSSCPVQAVDTQCGSAYKLTGMACFIKGDHENAVRHFQKYVSIFYGDAEAYKYLSLSYKVLRDEKSSAAYLEMNHLLLNQGGLSQDAFDCRKGVILLKNALYPEAVKILIRAAETRKKDHRILYNIGAGYLLMGEYSESVLYLERAAEIYGAKRINISKWIRMDFTGGKYFLVLGLAHLLNRENSRALLSFERVRQYDTYFYNLYKEDYRKGTGSKLYRQLVNMWED